MPCEDVVVCAYDDWSSPTQLLYTPGYLFYLLGGVLSGVLWVWFQLTKMYGGVFNYVNQLLTKLDYIGGASFLDIIAKH